MNAQDLDRLARDGGRFTLLTHKFEVSAPTATLKRTVTHLESGLRICAIQRYPRCYLVTSIHEERRTGVEVGYWPADLSLAAIVEVATVQSLRYHQIRVLKGPSARHIWDSRIKAAWLPWAIELTPEVAAERAPNLLSMLFGGQS